MRGDFSLVHMCTLSNGTLQHFRKSSFLAVTLLSGVHSVSEDVLLLWKCNLNRNAHTPAATFNTTHKWFVSYTETSHHPSLLWDCSKSVLVGIMMWEKHFPLSHSRFRWNWIRPTISAGTGWDGETVSHVFPLAFFFFFWQLPRWLWCAN